MVSETHYAILLGFPFFDKNEIIIDAHNRLLQTQEFTFQQNLMHIKGNNKQKRQNSRTKIMLKTKTTCTLSPGKQKSLELIPSEESDAQEQIGLVEPTAKFEKLVLGLTSTLEKLKNRTTTLLAINTTENPLHIRQNSPVITFEIITPEQARYLIPLEPKLFQSSDSKKTIKRIEKTIERTAKGEINHKIKHENWFWFPTPETNPDTSKMSTVEKRIYDKLVKFKNLEEFNNSRKTKIGKLF